MQLSILRAWSLLTLAGAVLLVSGPLAAAQDFRDILVGTWKVQVTQVDCTSGDALTPAFPSLVTFAVGGTMAEDTTNPVFAPGQRSAGQGVWHYKGGRIYTARSVAFINFTTLPDPTTHNPGFNAGGQAIAQTITLTDHNDWTSKAAIQFTDSTGAIYRQGCAIATAQRY